jgi:sortase A
VTVVEGSGDAELARSAGHIEETARPGEAGNIGIAGHRDTTFRPLRRLRIGDALLLTTRGHVQEFRVSRLWIVEPRDVHVLHPTGRTTLTLVTCYPFGFVGRAPQRYIVRADLVGARGRTAAASPAAPGSRG